MSKDSHRSSISKAFGHVLQQHRLAIGLSQENLSLAAGYDKNYVGMLERGERQPTLETLLDMAQALAVAPEQLVVQTRELLEP